MRLILPKVIVSTIFYLIITFIITILLEEKATGMFGHLSAWLTSINMVTMFAVGKDKLSEIFHLGMMQDGTVLWLGFFGGYPALFLSIVLFRHKIIRMDSRPLMWFMFALHIFIVLFYFVILDQSFAV